MMKLFSTLLLVMFFQFSMATTFYISPDGNDQTGNGSAGNPWKTLFKATSVVTNAGDIIHVNAGRNNITHSIHIN
jgi:hypothetical protein